MIERDRTGMIFLGLGILIAARCPSGVVAQDTGPQLVNGSFEAWNDAGPVGWTLEIGANHGANSPLSIVRQGDGPSLELSGDRSTRAWQMAGQSVPVTPGDTFRLAGQARTTDLRREGRQFDNCYVGVFQKDRRGKIVARNIWPINAAEYADVDGIVRIQPNVSVAQVVVFLSKSGTLNVRNVTLQRLDPADSFDILVADMDRYYSFFEHKGIDWPELTGRYRQAAQAANSPEQFADVVAQMLAELQDVHTWVVYHGKRYAKYLSAGKPNYDFRMVDNDLKSKTAIGKLAVVGKTADGLGYIRINTLTDVDPPSLQKLIRAIDGLLETPAMIVDLRSNAGGNEQVAGQIVSLFADQPRDYARQKFRTGPGHSGFYETPPRQIAPRNGKTYQRPVVCLIGPRAVSSAEGMALMMSALPHCTLIGQPTRGASGNPAPVSLPNGVDVWYSRWVSMTPDGDPIEGVGVQPDVVVEHGHGDPAWQEARAMLRKQ